MLGIFVVSGAPPTAAPAPPSATDRAEPSAAPRGTRDARVEAEPPPPSSGAECYGADEVAMVALNASVALSQSHARMAAALAASRARKQRDGQPTTIALRGGTHYSKVFTARTPS